MTSRDIFPLIGDFVQQLSTFFNAKEHIHDNQDLVKLALYERLIEHTGPTNSTAINKHLSAFTDWVNNNIDACRQASVLSLNPEFPNITYSDNVFIPINSLLYRIFGQKSNVDTLMLMWKHILNIAFRLTKDEEIKTKLIELYNPNQSLVKADSENKEEELINKTFNVIQSEFENMKDIKNPKEAISHMMNSGTFENLMETFVSGMENGNVDMNKLFNSVLKKTGTSGMDLSGLNSIMKMVGGDSNNLSKEDESIMFDFDKQVAK